MSRFSGLSPILGEKSSEHAVSLDWRAYWNEFNLRHGGDPVEFEGRLLWRDGWMHSASSYEGPEWRPPLPTTREGETALRRLVKAYWTLRRVKVAAQTEEMGVIIGELERLQDGRDGPLMRSQAEWYTDDHGKRRVKVVEAEVDVQVMRDRLEWLRQELKECDGRIEEADRGKSMVG